MTRILSGTDPHRIQQSVKWIVYTLLLVNFGFYIYEDWSRAIHTLTADSTWLDLAAEFATSIDEAGWFILLFMYELETYIFEDEDWKGWIAHTVHGVRLACFVMLAHTVFAYGNTVADYSLTQPVENASSLCDLAGQDVSFVYNLEYTAIDTGNCAMLSDAAGHYWVGKNPVVASENGLALERILAWVDLAEAVIWLLIVLSIETVVRMQGRGIAQSPVIRGLNVLKIGLYLVLFGMAAYWASLSHWLYAWDEFVWIAGFAIIESNVHEWRDELMENEPQAPA